MFDLTFSKLKPEDVLVINGKSYKVLKNSSFRYQGQKKVEMIKVGTTAKEPTFFLIYDDPLDISFIEQISKLKEPKEIKISSLKLIEKN